MDGEPVRFDDGRGYLGRDWGRAVPSAYVWLQTNHFARPDNCLTASIALVPWLRGEFRGMVVGLRAGRLHRFTTGTGARTTSLQIDDGHVRWSLRSRRGTTLDIVAERRRGGLLHAPVRTHMPRRVEETPGSRYVRRLRRPSAARGHRSLRRDRGARNLERLLATR